MRSYREWKFRENMTSTQTMPYVPAQSTFSMAPSQEMGNTTRQPPHMWAQQAAQQNRDENPDNYAQLMQTFIGWYKFHIGSWADVMRAASKNKDLSALIGTAEREFETQNNPNAEYQFGGLTFKGWGDLGRHIKKMTEKVIPSHGHDKMDDAPRQMPNEFMNSGETAHDDSDYEPIPDLGSDTEHGHISQGSFIQYLQSMEKRLANLEQEVKTLKTGTHAVEHHLSSAERKKLKPKDFAEPSKKAYPIEDEKHARNALSRVSQFGSALEKATIRRKVHKKYPDIGEK